MDRRSTIFRYWRLLNILILTIAFFSPWQRELSAFDVLFMALDSIHYPTSILGVVMLLSWPFYIILNGLKLRFGWTAPQALLALSCLVLGSSVHLLYASIRFLPYYEPYNNLEWGFYLALLGYYSSIIVEATEEAVGELWVILGAILVLYGTCWPFFYLTSLIPF